MSKYLDKNLLTEYLTNEIHRFDNCFYASDQHYQACMFLNNYLRKLLLKINEFNTEILENSKTANEIRQDYKDESLKWLDDEYIDKKQHWINKKLEQLYLDPHGEFIDEIVEMIIDE